MPTKIEREKEGNTQEKQESLNTILNEKGDYLPNMILNSKVDHLPQRGRGGERESKGKKSYFSDRNERLEKRQSVACICKLIEDHEEQREFFPSM